MWLYAFSHVETIQAFSSSCFGPSGNSLHSQALIIHDAGYRWPIFPAFYHGIGLFCVLWGVLTLTLENTPLLQGERQMRLYTAFRFSSNDDPFAMYIKYQIFQFIWQLPNFQADLEKIRSEELHDFREHFTIMQFKQSMCGKYIEHGIDHLAGTLLVQLTLSDRVNPTDFLYLLGQEGEG